MDFSVVFEIENVLKIKGYLTLKVRVSLLTVSALLAMSFALGKKPNISWLHIKSKLLPSA
jgi:hypothetical protein